MNPLSAAILEECRSDIMLRVFYYEKIGIPAFINIEYGLGRSIVSPTLPVDENSLICWERVGGVSYPPIDFDVDIDDDFDFSKLFPGFPVSSKDLRLSHKKFDPGEYYSNHLHPPNLIARFPEENRELYERAWRECVPGQAVVAIDYEDEETRGFFDPIVIDNSFMKLSNSDLEPLTFPGTSPKWAYSDLIDNQIAQSAESAVMQELEKQGWQKDMQRVVETHIEEFSFVFVAFLTHEEFSGLLQLTYTVDDTALESICVELNSGGCFEGIVKKEISGEIHMNAEEIIRATVKTVKQGLQLLID
ncbi:MAG: hypothetical protein KME38_24095 [Spirirestis rafaelensis WJT71-NPBG6]|jgi:hypothetical protein|nr:hypothetical protein [Spirirestis rafaelensis WJT71-NPBG6]